MLKIFLLLLTVFVSANVSAGAGIGAVVLKEVRVESGNVYLFTENSPSNPLNCDLANPIKLVPTDAGFDHMYSSALTALTTGKKLKLWLRSCVNSPWAKTILKAYATGLLAE